jgi:hypothetical protein
MPPSLAAPGSNDLAAAKARHPAGRLLGRRSDPPLRFTDAVALLTGRWRVSDPVGFAVVMTSAPVVAGHRVTELSDVASEDLVAVLTGIAQRSKLALWWVSGIAAGDLHVEARAEAAAGGEGPEVFVLAHLVEPVGFSGRQAVPADHSWIVVVVGDGSGGVAHVARATLGCPRRPRCCPPPMSSARFPLAALRTRLITPALEADAASSPPPAVVLPLPRRG